MANVEQISQVAMQVITYSGLAKSSYLEALKYYRKTIKQLMNNHCQMEMKVLPKPTKLIFNCYSRK